MEIRYIVIIKGSLQSLDWNGGYRVKGHSSYFVMEERPNREGGI